MTDADVRAVALWIAHGLVKDGIYREWLPYEMPSLVPHDIARIADALDDIAYELSRVGDHQ